jgi:hypothetical protein
MALFGWCLPDMPIEQHNKCTTSFEYAGVIECACLCHTDKELFIKELTKSSITPIKKRNKKTNDAN